MYKEIKIGKKRIGAGNPCFVIAEAGVNHNGDLKKALELGVSSPMMDNLKIILQDPIPEL